MGDTIKYGRGDVPKLIAEARAAGRREGLEEAAKVVDAEEPYRGYHGYLGDQIRALLTQPAPKPAGISLVTSESIPPDGVVLRDDKSATPKPAGCTWIYPSQCRAPWCPIHSKPAAKPHRSWSRDGSSTACACSWGADHGNPTEA